MSNIVVLKDANGVYCPFELNDLTPQLIERAFTIFGLDLDTVGAMRRVLMRRGAPLRPTVEDVERIFDGC